MTKLAEVGAEMLGGTLDREEPLPGGGLSQIRRIWLADGRAAIVKDGPAPQAEARMLNAIAASGAPAPAVLAASDQALVIEVIAAGGSLNGGWTSLGSALAVLHRVEGERYGWHENYAFGSVTIENAWSDNWVSFWAERRLLTSVAEIPPRLARRVETLAADLGNRLPARPRAMLLHGDLWGGNVLVAGSDVSGLIDPACYYGHREVDLAMLTLFDNPDAAFFDAYGALEQGYEERLLIYRLWPALVHLRLFGGGYQSLVDRHLSMAGV